jgi:hypothetical protein
MQVLRVLWLECFGQPAIFRHLSNPFRMNSLPSQLPPHAFISVKELEHLTDDIYPDVRAEPKQGSQGRNDKMRTAVDSQLWTATQVEIVPLNPKA